MKIAVATATLALGAVPALAIASAPGNSGSAPGHNKTSSTGTTTKPTPPGHAYGRLCQNQSKKHVKGTPGTPFSTCVKAMAKIANGSTTNPHAACAKMSKKHVKGTPGTPYSNCVKAAAKLLAEKRAAEDAAHDTTTTPTPTTG
jgi:hypothetical protein